MSEPEPWRTCWLCGRLVTGVPVVLKIPTGRLLQLRDGSCRPQYYTEHAHEACIDKARMRLASDKESAAGVS